MKSFSIIGSNGFIGKEIQRITPPSAASYYSHNPSHNEYHFDIKNTDSWHTLLSNSPKRLLILSWPGLSDYENSEHATINLPRLISLVGRLAQHGLEELVVAGTCYEYGLQNGCISPHANTLPTSIYGIAKDSLNKILSVVCHKHSIRYCWARIFFPFGESQRQSSLFPSLINDARCGKDTIELGCQDLVRDFIPVEQVAERLLQLIQSSSASGNYNCGTGKPKTLRTFVEQIISEYDLNIKPLYNIKPLRAAEPFAYWADMQNWACVEPLRKQ